MFQGYAAKAVGKLKKISFFLSINFDTANYWCKFKACMPNFDATRLNASGRTASSGQIKGTR